MAVSRVPHVDRQFRVRVEALEASFRPVSRNPSDLLFPESRLSLADSVALFEAQLTSRWLDYVARELKNEGLSFYTIGSAGHEGNAMVGQLTRYSDPAFLHYRSGGFYFARARQVPGQTPIFDTALSLTASSEDPISGGRHKVWGSLALQIPPQTSTIASHLPKAVGTAFFLERRKSLARGIDLPEDSIAICSFGDASANHSTAVGAINAAACCAYQHLPLPLLLVCEDNGIGISVHTSSGWIQSNYENRAGLTYFRADGLDFTRGYAVVQQAVDYCRHHRRPVFLHLKTVRLLGHAGGDVETAYLTRQQLEEIEARDPLLTSAVRLIEAGAMSPGEVLELYEATARQVRAAGREAAGRPKHLSAATIMAPLFPDYETPCPTAEPPDPLERDRFWYGRLPEDQKPRHLGQLINWGLLDLGLRHEDLVLFGEDVAKKGGVYNITADLRKKLGLGRVFNTLLDEQAILGLAIGAGHCGLIPIPEIQYLAYLHNAIDQIRGEACSLGFFSEGRFRNPMVIRIAGFAYQKGFGGHFHNDNAFAALREIPGLILVTASNGPDAVRLMRTCVDLARQHGAVIAFLEPIALYKTKDLVGKGDWMFAYPSIEQRMPFGEVGLHGDPDAGILIISYANGYYLSRQACFDLERGGVRTQILDLRFLLPLNKRAILAAAKGKHSVVIVDECRQTASISEEITTLLVEEFQEESPHISRVLGENTYIPLGHAWEWVLPSRKTIYDAVKERSTHG